MQIFLVEEAESGVLKDKIHIRFKEFKNNFAAKTDKMDNPSSTQTFFSTVRQQTRYPFSSPARRFGQ